MDRLTTFPNRPQQERAEHVLREHGVAHGWVAPDPAYSAVGVPALVCGNDAPAVLAEAGVVASGWVDFRSPGTRVPPTPHPVFAEDVFGQCAIVLLAPCVADVTKIRLIAHTSGDLAEVFPYLNAEMPAASYNRETETLTYQDAYRMISLYPHRITVAKADDIVDTWRVLEAIRCLASRTWARRGEVTPVYQQRSRPPALEIYKRLPGTNCRECGDKTCMAFACRLWRGEGRPEQCRPVFTPGRYARLGQPLLQICAGLGLGAGMGEVSANSISFPADGKPQPPGDIPWLEQ